MATVFTNIIQGKIPCHKVKENEHFLAFLDIRPLKAGHTLVIPKIEIDYLFDLNDDLFSRLFLFAKEAALLLQKAVKCRRIGIMVAGLEVPHAHIHLVPIDLVSDLDFSKAAPADNQQLAALAAKIRSYHEK